MKVHIEKIASYDTEKIRNYLEKVFAAEKIWQDLESRKTKKVLLKPNLLGPHHPDKAVTTHPKVVEAMILLLQEKGYQIYIADSPGGNVSLKNLFEVTGMQSLVDKYNIERLHKTSAGEKGIVETEKDGFKMILDKQMMEFSAIINLCKYKTHSLTLFTGAVKNLFGIVPGLIKSDYHRYYPQPDKLAELLVKIYAEVKSKVVINIMDGIVGMEGEGPSSGTAKNFGLMFASKSASALDYVASSMLGYQAIKIPTVKLSLENDELQPEQIDIDERWKGFVFEGTSIGKASMSSAFINALPQFLQKIFFKVYDYYPDFNKNCVLCLVCKEGCPVKAISFDEKKSNGDKKKLVINRKTCIKCLCCQEFCQYRAINLKKTLLARFILRD